MPNTLLTNERIIEEVRLVLGGSTIEVELDDKDILLGARRALRTYNRYIPFQGKAVLAVSTAVKKYRIDQLYTGFIGVVDVDFITDQVSPSTVDPFDPYYASLTGMGYGAGDQTFGDVMQQRMYAEDVSRIVSAEPEWHGQWEVVTVGSAREQQYFLYVDIVRSTMQCSYTYNCEYQDTDDPGWGRPAIPIGDTQWLIDYVVAFCKQPLARILGKHGGIAGPDGQTDQTDADQLRQESREDMERLETEIKARKRVGVPLTE